MEQGRSSAHAEADERARALWWILAALVLVRAALAFVPAMWGWGVNLLRFVAPAPGWLLWALSALALVPAAASGALPAARAAGNAIAGGRLGARLWAAVGAAALVSVFPDRVLYVGDALLRRGTLETQWDPRVLASGAGQFLPLDRLLHYTLPRAAAAAGVLGPDTFTRGLGALEAALLALITVEFTRALAVRGPAALATAAAVFFGGYLALYTGYDKSYTELCLVTAALATAGLRCVREGRSSLALGVLVAVGFLLHRSALALVPAAAFARIVASRVRPARTGRERLTDLASIALPLLTLGLMLPRILATAATFDVRQHLTGQIPAAGGTESWAHLGILRLVDVVNFTLLMAPASALAPLLLLPRGPAAAEPARGREAWFLALLALPFLGMVVVLHPGSGVFRDWDVFAAGGVTFGLLAAGLLARALPRGGQLEWIALALLAAVAAPTLAWLLHNADPERGLARARAFALEPPTRTEVERAVTWEYLGYRTMAAGRPEETVEALRRSAELSPSPRMLYTLGTAELRAGRPADARGSFTRALARDSTALPAWIGLAHACEALGDLEGTWRAAREVARLLPGDPGAQRAFAHVDSIYRAEGKARR